MEQLTDNLLTVEQAAERLGATVRFVRRLVNERRIRFYHVGKYVRFDPADVQAFIRQGVVEPVTLRRTYRNGVSVYA
jgi:excisionase family DNA binding protein